MYVIPIIFLILALIFIIIFHFKKRGIIKKIKCMSFEEKCCILNDISYPFGYCYIPEQDIFSSTVDAWQKNFGYTHAYDVGAAYFNMVFDYQTVYFDYNKKTWLIELWKGQYGINTGCEVGIYHADNIIPPKDYNKTLFDAASDEEMLPLSVTLTKKDRCLGSLKKPHWWLTIFDMGMFSKPKQLSMEVSVTFPDCHMLNSFKNSLFECMPDTVVTVHGHTIHFTFTKCCNRYSLWKRIVRAWALIWCRIFCMIFCFVTRPFKRSGDKILYLYYYLPFIFRKTLRLHRIPKQKKCRKNCKRKFR